MAVTHGLASTYRNWRGGCRCDECRDASTERARRERRSRIERLAADPTLAPHGSQYTYRNWGCRCKPCTYANAADCRRRKVKRDATR